MHRLKLDDCVDFKGENMQMQMLLMIVCHKYKY